MTDHIGHLWRHTIYYVDKWVYSLKTELPLHRTLSSFIFPVTESLPPQLFSSRKPGLYLSFFHTKWLLGGLMLRSLLMCVYEQLYVCIHHLHLCCLLYNMSHDFYQDLLTPRKCKAGNTVAYQRYGFAILRLNPTNKRQYKG